MNEPALLTVAEVAKYLRLSERTIRDMIGRGEIKAIKLGKAYRIKKTDVLEKMPNASSAQEITVKDFKHSTDIHSDADGWGFTWTCPDCYDTVTWAPGAWWKMECRCRSWDVDIRITGTKKEL